MTEHYESKEIKRYAFDHYLILFRDKDTWKPGHVVYESRQDVIEAAEQYSRAGQMILIIPAIAIPGQSPGHVSFNIVAHRETDSNVQVRVVE